MTNRVRLLSGRCPAPRDADTAHHDDHSRAGNALRDGDLAVPDSLSAETDMLSYLDKPDKIPPPYRGGLSVSTQINTALYASVLEAEHTAVPASWPTRYGSSR